MPHLRFLHGPCRCLLLLENGRIWESTRLHSISGQQLLLLPMDQTRISSAMSGLWSHIAQYSRPPIPLYQPIAHLLQMPCSLGSTTSDYYYYYRLLQFEQISKSQGYLALSQTNGILLPSTTDRASSQPVSNAPIFGSTGRDHCICPPTRFHCRRFFFYQGCCLSRTNRPASLGLLCPVDCPKSAPFGFRLQPSQTSGLCWMANDRFLQKWIGIRSLLLADRHSGTSL